MKKLLAILITLLLLYVGSAFAADITNTHVISDSYIPFDGDVESIESPYEVFDFVAPVSSKVIKYRFLNIFPDAVNKFSYSIETDTCFMDIYLNEPFTLSFLSDHLNAFSVFDNLEEHRSTALSIIRATGEETNVVFNVITADGYLIECYSDDGWQSYFRGDFNASIFSPCGEYVFSSSLVLDSFYKKNMDSFIRNLILKNISIENALIDGFFDTKTNSCVLRFELTSDYQYYSEESILSNAASFDQALQSVQTLFNEAHVYINNVILTCDHSGTVIQYMKNGNVYTPSSCHLGHYVNYSSSSWNCEVCCSKIERWPKLTAIEAMYNYTNNKGKSFHLKGYGELSNYYNYGYDGYEDNYFCLKVLPEGGKYSESWYVYLSRSSFSEVFDLALSNGKVRVEMECNINEYESGQNNMAKAVYVKWWK